MNPAMTKLWQKLSELETALTEAIRTARTPVPHFMNYEDESINEGDIYNCAQCGQQFAIKLTHRVIPGNRYRTVFEYDCWPHTVSGPYKYHRAYLWYCCSEECTNSFQMIVDIISEEEEEQCKIQWTSIKEAKQALKTVRHWLKTRKDQEVSSSRKKESELPTTSAT